VGKLKSKFCAALFLVVITGVLGLFPVLGFLRAASPPQIIGYQGRLADSNGDLLGGTGTTYYFRFSIYDASSGGSKLWPSGTPCSHGRTVTEGVFTAGVGDTSECADVLDLNFRDNNDIYLEVEVSSDDSTFETLTPRQRITSSAFSQLSGAVSGTASTSPSTFGTTTPIGNSSVTIEATSTTAIPLSIRAASGQSANLFQVQGSDASNLLYIDSSGNLFAGTISAGTWQGTAVGETYGGTGTTTYSTGDILYADATNSLTKLAVGSNGQVLKLSGGVPTWDTDSTGGGGSGAWATTTDDLVVYPVDTADVVVIGSNATTSTGNIFEVIGSSLFDNVSVGGTLSVTGLTTLGQASSTRFSVFDTAYFGGSATSTFDSAGVLTLVAALLETSGGTGQSTYVIGDIL